MKIEDLMIGTAVPYNWGNANKPCYAKIIAIRITTDIISGKRTGIFTERTFTIKDDANNRIRDGYKLEHFEAAAKKHLEYLRKELRAERLSYEELSELAGLADWIEAGDVELAEAAGIPEEEFAKR